MENNETRTSSLDDAFDELSKALEATQETDAVCETESAEEIQAYYQPAAVEEEAAEPKHRKPNGEKKKQNSSRKAVIIAIIAVLVAGAAVAGWLLFGGKKFEVVFKDDSGNVLETVKVKEGSNVPDIEHPKKEGFIFSCWEFNGNPLAENKKVEADMTLKAVFKKEMTVNFCYEDGTIFKQVKVAQGDKVVKPDTVPEVKDKAFVSWTKSDEAGDFDFNTAIMKDTNIIAKMKDYIKPTGFAFSQQNYTVEIKQTQDCHATVTPSNTTEKVTYRSGSEELFTVDEKGVVTGKKEGTAKLFATCDGKEISTTINVKEVKATAISIKEGPSILIGRGKTIELHVDFTPENVSDKTLKYSSSDEKIAKLDEKGNLQAVAKGKCNITVTASNNISSQIPVEVFVPVESISIIPNRSAISYDAHTYAEIKASVYPADADIQTVGWTTSDAGGQNGSYDLAVNGNIAKLTGRENSRYQRQCSVAAYVVNADGNKVSSESVVIYGEPQLAATVMVNGVETASNPVVVVPGDSVYVTWNAAGSGDYSAVGLVGGPGGVSETDYSGVVWDPPEIDTVSFNIVSNGGQYLSLTFQLGEN